MCGCWPPVVGCCLSGFWVLAVSRLAGCGWLLVSPARQQIDCAEPSSTTQPLNNPGTDSTTAQQLNNPTPQQLNSNSPAPNNPTTQQQPSSPTPNAPPPRPTRHQPNNNWQRCKTAAVAGLSKFRHLQDPTPNNRLGKVDNLTRVSMSAKLHVARLHICTGSSSSPAKAPTDQDFRPHTARLLTTALRGCQATWQGSNLPLCKGSTDCWSWLQNCSSVCPSSNTNITLQDVSTLQPLPAHVSTALRKQSEAQLQHCKFLLFTQARLPSGKVARLQICVFCAFVLLCFCASVLLRFRAPARRCVCASPFLCFFISLFPCFHVSLCLCLFVCVFLCFLAF